MKISLNWIKDYIDLTGISTEEISDRLTNSGLEVEGVEDKGKLYDKFVVGYVKERKKHPNADKLSLCVVSTGSEEFNVVCGAPNVEAGQKIPFAMVGAVVPQGGFEITKAKIRGEVSMGMICSERELALSDNHQGIMVLNPEIPEGTPLAEALGLNDVVFEIGITPNRSDALSHFGVARDLAAIFGRKVKLPEISFKESEEKVEDAASVEIVNTKGCPRYSAKVVRNVEIKESPEWLKNRLINIGLRPINNVVDVTNYVMYETGQPLHGFDLNMLKGNKIVVRNASEGEKFVTLDSKERALTANDVMICDAEKPVAVAGVMGGENSEVTPATKDILIESAYFNPSSVRKTSKALTLSTDASYRFERGTDPNNTVYAAERAAQLIAELAGGVVLKGTIDVYPEKIEPVSVSIRLHRITKVLGFEVPAEDVKQILINLGLELQKDEGDTLTFSVPTFRSDLEREIDLIEEVARIYGYDKIPTIEKITITLNRKTDESAFRDSVRNAAVALGFSEMVNNSLQSEEIASVTGNPVRLLNPLSTDMSVLRTSLIPGALQTVARNINVGERSLMLFETGNVFEKLNEGEIKDFSDFTETEKAVFIITGFANQAEWYEKERPFDFYDLKGMIAGFLEKIYLDNVADDSYYLIENKIFEYSWTKSANGAEIGTGGLIRKEILKKFDIPQDVFCFEFSLTELSKLEPRAKSYKELLKYPRVVRDCAFILSREVSSDEVIKAIQKGSSKLLRQVNVFDVFESDALGQGRKSMAFSLTYYDENRTLKDEEVEKDFNRAVQTVVKDLNAEFRGS